MDVLRNVTKVGIDSADNAADITIDKGVGKVDKKIDLAVSQMTGSGARFGRNVRPTWRRLGVASCAGIFAISAGSCGEPKVNNKTTDSAVEQRAVGAAKQVAAALGVELPGAKPEVTDCVGGVGERTGRRFATIRATLTPTKDVDGALTGLAADKLTSFDSPAGTGKVWRFAVDGVAVSVAETETPAVRIEAETPCV